jgi:hypothetical protein
MQRDATQDLGDVLAPDALCHLDRQAFAGNPREKRKASRYERLAAAAEEALGGSKPGVASSASHDQIAVEDKLPPPKLR